MSFFFCAFFVVRSGPLAFRVPKVLQRNERTARSEAREVEVVRTFCSCCRSLGRAQLSRTLWEWLCKKRGAVAKPFNWDHLVPELPIRVGQWQSIGATPNTVAAEVAMDALARQREQHPIDIRLVNLRPENVRLAACLEKLRELCEMKPRLSQPGFGRGYACGTSTITVTWRSRSTLWSIRPRSRSGCCPGPSVPAVTLDAVIASATGGLGMDHRHRLRGQ
jgi:hypothetical protein